MWESYLPLAIESNKVLEKTLYYLSKYRYLNLLCKKIVDPLRGVFATFLYSNDKGKNKLLETLSEDRILFCFRRLLDWLSATDEFEQEVIRLTRWYNFLSALSREKRVSIIEKCVKLENWFRNMSNERLGKYTANVERFLEQYGKKHFYLEDVIFCNIPAQCVLLDYCGCKTHWDSTGIVTAINEEKLVQIIG